MTAIPARVVAASADPLFNGVYSGLTLRVTDGDHAALVFSTTDIAIGVPSAQLVRGAHPDVWVVYTVALSKANSVPLRVNLADALGLVVTNPSSLLFAPSTTAGGVVLAVNVTTAPSNINAPAPGVSDGAIVHTLLISSSGAASCAWGFEWVGGQGTIQGLLLLGCRIMCLY